ncbi:hypothetical protein CRM22_000542 [Opisthorchis felineus]|uniref:Nuclear transport factor 2 n=1 Tax=Opisthorchis felineus TaxID=147828 RepID=A0A4S2MLC7_OPIFE|nr:hypothetical protein CRM22_000542 [Opisthorchis felineus]
MQAIQPSADEIGKQFAAQYYQTLQTSRPAIRNFYHEQARMIYEGDEVVGRENIAQKLQNIKCNTLQFALSSVDAQPCGNAILILVCGQLQIGMRTDFVQEIGTNSDAHFCVYSLTKIGRCHSQKPSF